MPTKIGVHIFDINPYLHKFIELIPIDFFLMTMDYSPWSERKIWLFFLSSNISKTGDAMPTKIGVHAFDINPYLHKFIELIPID